VRIVRHDEQTPRSHHSSDLLECGPRVREEPQDPDHHDRGEGAVDEREIVDVRRDPEGLDSGPERNPDEEFRSDVESGVLLNSLLDHRGETTRAGPEFEHARR